MKSAEKKKIGEALHIRLRIDLWFDYFENLTVSNGQEIILFEHFKIRCCVVNFYQELQSVDFNKIR